MGIRSLLIVAGTIGDERKPMSLVDVSIIGTRSDTVDRVSRERRDKQSTVDGAYGKAG